MNKTLENILEILASLFIVGGLLYVAFYVKPSVTVPGYTPTMFAYRDHYYSVVSPDQQHKVFWAVGNNGKIIRSDNAGDNWHIQKSGTKRNLQSMAPWDSQSAIVVGDLATVLTTDDGGKSWSKSTIETYEYGDQLLQVYADPASGEAWLSGTMATVMKSKDRGQTWKMTHPQEDLAWNDITVAPDGSVWVVGEFGRMQRSVDDGASWQEIETPTSGSSLMAIAFSDRQHGLVVGLSGTVFSSADGGDSWTLVPDVTQAHFFDVSWDGEYFVAIGDTGVLAIFSEDGKPVHVGRIHTNNSGWYTQVTPLSADRLLIAGSNLGLHFGKDWHVFQ